MIKAYSLWWCAEFSGVDAGILGGNYDSAYGVYVAAKEGVWSG